MSDDRFDNHRYHNEDTFTVQATAGAVPVRNKKGEISMQKVKVNRYVSGKRPDFARGDDRETHHYHHRGGRGRHYQRHSSSSDDSSDEEDFTKYRRERRGRDRGDEDADEDEDEDEAGPSSSATAPSARGSRWDQTVKKGGRDDADAAMSDPRLRRLMMAKMRESSDEDSGGEEDGTRPARRRLEAQVLSGGEEEGDQEQQQQQRQRPQRRRPGRGASSSSSSDSDSDGDGGDESDLDEEAVSRKRELMRQRALAKAQIGLGTEEVMAKEEEREGESEEEDSSEEEETTDDSDEEEDARLKPVFVRKKDRLTTQEHEQELARERAAEREEKLRAEGRRRETLRLVENIVKETAVERKARDNDPTGLNEVDTDDEQGDNEAEYEAWKLRELRRVKKAREEREAAEAEREELERMRSMTEEERKQMEKINPKQVTNKAAKGKYKFLQKYYHRGAFYMADEENLYKRDYSSATLEDKFDKTVLPKVMQVKNFGRSGRTKYTHLVDQDTTEFDAAWSQETQQNLKFQISHAGGMKQNFDRPSAKKKKYE